MTRYRLSLLVSCILITGCCISPPRDVSADADAYPGTFKPGELYETRKDVWTGEFLEDQWHTGTRIVLAQKQTEFADEQVPHSQVRVQRGTQIRIVKLVRVCWDVMPLTYAHRVVPIGVIQNGPLKGTWVDLQYVATLSFPPLKTHPDVIAKPDLDVLGRVRDTHR